MRVVADDPPTLIAGDLVDTIDEALALVPDGATPVVFHSAVLNYVSPADRQRFAARLDEHPDVVWISNEGPGVLDGVTTDLVVPVHASSAAHFLVVLRGRVVGISDPHGSWIRWASTAAHHSAMSSVWCLCDLVVRREELGLQTDAVAWRTPTVGV